VESCCVEIDIKLSSARQRCRALHAHASRLETQQYASPGAYVVRGFVERSSKLLDEFLEGEATNPDLELLEPRERETRIHRACKLVPFLYQVLGILSGAETNQTPAELVLPLRRSLRKILPRAEILLRSGPDLNYSIDEIAAALKAFQDAYQELTGRSADDICRLFSETTSKAAVPEILPPTLYMMSIPSVEANEVLLHAILAHEAGHGFYDQKKLADKVLPKVEVPAEQIKELARTIALGQRGVDEQKNKTISFPLQEIGLRDLLTRVVTGTISDWVAELACDVLGVMIFGPAYFFAFIHLYSTLAMLDEASESHPPPRLRIRLMCSCLRHRFRISEVDPRIAELIAKWEAVGRGDIKQGRVEFSLALNSVSPQILTLIEEVVAGAVPDTLAYSSSQFADDINDILPLLKENVPAAEVVRHSHSGLEPPEMAHLLNAGWVLLLARFQEFRENLPTQVGADALASQNQLNKLLLKSFELAEIKRRWTEVTNQAKG
jgi:hypothetical protein